MNIDTSAAKRESRSPEKVTELKIVRPRAAEQNSPALSFRKQDKEAKSPTHRRERTTVKRFKDEDRHKESSVGDSPSRPDSPASIMKSQRSRDSRKKSHRKRNKDSDEEKRVERIQLNLGENVDSPRLPSRNDDVIMGQQKRILEQISEFKKELIHLQKAFNTCQE